jgi:PAS domain S-box-containing protein
MHWGTEEPALARLVEERREDILQRWVERVRRHPPDGRQLPLPELRDCLPAFLQQLVEDLRREASSSGPGASDSVKPAAEEHGRQRFREGTDIQEVVREYSLLWDVLWDFVEEQKLPLRLAELRVLTRGLTTGIAEAVEYFSREREKERGALLAREQALDRFFAVTPDMLCVVGLDGYFKRINPAFSATLDYTEAELLTTPVQELVHPEDWPATLAELEKLSQGHTTLHFINRYRCKQGGWRWLSWNASLDMKTGFLAAAARDITEDKQRSEFEQQLIGIVSHDLRNPLNTVLLSCTALLRREDLDERTTKVIARIQASADRAVRMIRDLLDFTQARLGGGLPVHPRAMDLHTLTRQLVEELHLGHPEREVRVEQQGPGSGQWDPDRIAQVVTNLVTNALKYSPEGTPVTVRTVGGEDAVTLSVHNKGEPISSELLPHIFEPMYRGTQDTASRSVGLGLYIVQHVVRAHGGELAVHSTREEGTTLTVRLPRTRLADTSAGQEG